jgi:hypothetical protein
VVDRRVTEAADDDGVGRPRRCDAQLVGPVDGEGDTDGAGQVRRDRRGLRDDGEVVVPEHLVAATGDGLVDRGHHPGEHVAQRFVTGRLPGPLDVERARAVVQEGRIGRPQCRGDGRVALVTRRADRVEALSPPAEPPRGQIEVATAELAVEQLEGAGAGQRRSGAEGARRVAERLDRRQRGQGREQRLLQGFGLVVGHG